MQDFEHDFEHGTERHREASLCLKRSGLMTLLSDFDPIWAGTIPIDIDIEDSDIDVICEVHDIDAFLHILEGHVSDFEDYRCQRAIAQGHESCVVSFTFEGFLFEVFAQPLPTRSQNAYRHMLAEHRLLERYGEGLRSIVRALERAGLKTEPAFAKALGLDGDPYLILLELGDLDDDALESFCAEHPLCSNL